MCHTDLRTNGRVSDRGAKQSALLIATPPVQAAPLWDHKAETITCKVIIGADGNIGELLTGKQLCEFVDWDPGSSV